jgi:hypothetical protein
MVQGVAVRAMAVRGLAGLFALSWLVLPGFGLIDLSVTWSADWPEALEAGWGLFSTVIVGAAFGLVAIRPRSTVPAVAQLVVATVALAVSTVVAKEGRLFVLAALLGLQTAIVAGPARGSWPWHPRSSRASRPLLVVAAAGAVPWLVYALHMWALNRENRSDSDITLGIDHYSMQGALAVSLAVLPLLAALREEARALVAASAGVAAFYLALVSLAWPNSAGALDKAWSAAAIAWALALLAGSLLQKRNDPRMRVVP